MSLKSANLPEVIAVYLRNPVKITTAWDDFDIQIGVGKEISVCPVMIADCTNKKTNETAEKWAKGNSWCMPSTSFRKEIIPNTPLSVKIVSLEHRGNGGRAYKVIVGERYYFDLREDVLLDSILEVGISAGGVINGEFVFATVNSQMKMIRVGSLLHEQILKYMDLSKKTSIDKLEAGCAYRRKTSGPEGYIYLGEFFRHVYEVTEKISPYRHLRFASSTSLTIPQRYSFKFDKKEIIHIFVDAGLIGKDYIYSESVKSTVAFVEKLDTPKKSTEEIDSIFKASLTKYKGRGVSYYSIRDVEWQLSNNLITKDPDKVFTEEEVLAVF